MDGEFKKGQFEPQYVKFRTQAEQQAEVLVDPLEQNPKRAKYTETRSEYDPRKSYLERGQFSGCYITEQTVGQEHPRVELWRVTDVDARDLHKTT